MIERHVTFVVPDGHAEEFEALFAAEYRPAMAAKAGFARVDLLRRQEHPTEYQMVIRFDTAEHAAAWRASAEHKAVGERLRRHYASSALTVYDVVA